MKKNNRTAQKQIKHSTLPKNTSVTQNVTAPSTSVSQSDRAEQAHRTDERAFWDRQIRAARWLNWITLGGGVVAAGSFIFVFIGLFDNREAIVYANRAWIAPIGMILDVEHSTNKSITLRVLYQNVGKVPATDMTIATVPDIYDGPVDALHPDLPISLNRTCQPENPGKAPVWPLGGTATNFTAIELTDAKFLNGHDIKNGKKTLYVEGCITYMTFEKVHHSAFCFYLKPWELGSPNDQLTAQQESGEQSQQKYADPAGTKTEPVFVVCPTENTSYAD